MVRDPGRDAFEVMVFDQAPHVCPRRIETDRGPLWNIDDDSLILETLPCDVRRYSKTHFQLPGETAQGPPCAW